MFYGRKHLAANPPNGFVPLFDRDGVLPGDGTWQRPSTPWWPAKVVDEFFYAIAQSPIVVGRGEVLLQQSSVLVLRQQLLAQLMYAENGYAPAGGLKRFRRFLTDEQVAELLSMPPITDSSDELVACHRWLVQCFVPRARALANRLGVEYPEALERSALRRAGF